MKYIFSILFIVLISVNSFAQTKSCLKLIETSKSGNYFGGDITISGSNVKGELSFADPQGDGYSMSFIGTKSGETLTVQVTYSNDSTGPKDEQWTLNQTGLTTLNPALTMAVNNCN